jgi:peptidyl-prolyl cis-trans isomerase C
MKHWRGLGAKLLREPLVHFMVAGALVFAFSLWRGEAADPASRMITITESQVTRLAASWEQSWRRPPTPAELDALVRDSVKEEVYVREAQKLGLDQDDPIIRRRLRAKMEFLATAEVENAIPTDATLSALLAKDPARYANDPVLSFDQHYLGTDTPETRAQAANVLARLSHGETVSAVPISLPVTLKDAPKSRIAQTFGDNFASALLSLTTGRWSGPVASGYGLHLVRIRSVSAPKPPGLAEARQRLENDWRAATMAERQARAYQTLLDGYTIQIEKP